MAFPKRSGPYLIQIDEPEFLTPSRVMKKNIKTNQPVREMAPKLLLSSPQACLGN